MWLLLNTDRRDLEEAARMLHRDSSDAADAMFGVACTLLDEQAELVVADVMDALRVAQELTR